MNQRTKKIGTRVILIWMLWPLIPSLLASMVAWIGGCKLDEGGVHKCVVLGNDIGGTLYVMAMFGFYGMATVPTGLIALIVFRTIVWWSDRAARAK